jgi:hypothetical protein
MKFAVLLHAQPAADAWSADAASRTVAAALDAWKPEAWAAGPAGE